MGKKAPNLVYVITEEIHCAVHCYTKKGPAYNRYAAQRLGHHFN